jgi:hypothetical protein
VSISTHTRAVSETLLASAMSEEDKSSRGGYPFLRNPPTGYMSYSLAKWLEETQFDEHFHSLRVVRK